VRPIRVIAAIVVALSLPIKVVAQDPDTAVTDTAAAAPLFELEGVTVTVTRGRAALVKLPYAVSLLSTAEIQGLEATISLDESLIEIPGVIVNNRYNFALGNRIAIRGSGARSQFGVRGIRILQDGIPLTLPDGQSQLNNLDLAAAGRVEVIRGPASSLYGNASGGVISVQTELPPLVPLRPELWLLGGRFDNGGSYQKYDLKAAGASTAFDYSGHLSVFQTDGYRLHSNAKYTLFNGTLRYRPDDSSVLTAVINYANAPRADNPSSLPDSLARSVPDTARDIALSPEQCPSDSGFGGCQNLGEESKQGQLGLTYRRWLGEAHEVSLMGYGVFRTLDNRIPFTLIEIDRRVAGARAEYRLAPLSGQLSALTVGVDFDHQHDDRLERARDDESVGPVTLDQLELVTGLGLFVFGGWLFGTDLQLTASARYDLVQFEADDRLLVDGDDSGARTMDQLSPMVGLRYTPRSWLNLYANVGRSFQTPTTTELTDTLGGFNQELDPERAINYEIGLKGTAAGRMSYSLAIFRQDIVDQIIGFELTQIGRSFFRNAGSSDYTGVEAALSTLLTDGLVLALAYTYSDFRFDEFATDLGDFSGNRVPSVPRNQLFLRLSYGVVAGISSTLRLTAVDEYFVDNANANRNDGYVSTDLRFGYELRLGGIEMVPLLGINNLFDERFNSSVVVNASRGNFFEPAPGRNFYVGLRMRTR
jgi:iron complex outermembrane receptor protein